MEDLIKHLVQYLKMKNFYYQQTIIISLTINEIHIHYIQTLKIFQAENTRRNSSTGCSQLNHNHWSTSGIKKSSTFTCSLLLWICINREWKARNYFPIISILSTVDTSTLNILIMQYKRQIISHIPSQMSDSHLRIWPAHNKREEEEDK